MDFIDTHDDLKKYWEEYINIDCRKQSEHLNDLQQLATNIYNYTS